MIIKKEVHISFLKQKRMLHIYLPDNFQTLEPLPVLYMFDGHNLFYDEDATYHRSWGLKKYLDLHKNKLIVVGIECNHEGNQRLCEFSPYSFNDKDWGTVNACGKRFFEWIINELKPYIDRKFSTLKNRENTFLAGSSMGGLMALYGGAMHPDIFSKAICLSTYYNHIFPSLTNDLMSIENLSHSTFYISFGAKEWKQKNIFAKEVENNLRISRILTYKKATIYLHCYENGLHNEESWEKEIPIFFKELKIEAVTR